MKKNILLIALVLCACTSPLLAKKKTSNSWSDKFSSILKPAQRQVKKTQDWAKDVTSLIRRSHSYASNSDSTAVLKTFGYDTHTMGCYLVGTLCANNLFQRILQRTQNPLIANKITQTSFLAGSSFVVSATLDKLLTGRTGVTPQIATSCIIASALNTLTRAATGHPLVGNSFATNVGEPLITAPIAARISHILLHRR